MRATAAVSPPKADRWRWLRDRPSCTGCRLLLGRRTMLWWYCLTCASAVVLALRVTYEAVKQGHEKQWRGGMAGRRPAPAANHDINAYRCSCIERGRRQQSHCKFLQPTVVWKESANVQDLRGVRRADEAPQRGDGRLPAGEGWGRKRCDCAPNASDQPASIGCRQIWRRVGRTAQMGRSCVIIC